MIKILTVIVSCDDNLYIALCPELDIVSQGKAIVQAKGNLREAIELFDENSDPIEIGRRHLRKLDAPT